MINSVESFTDIQNSIWILELYYIIFSNNTFHRDNR